MPRTGVAFGGVGQRVQARVGGQLGWHPRRHLRVYDGNVSDVLAVAQPHLALLLRIGQHDAPRDLGPGPTGGGDSDQARLLAQAQADEGIDLGRVQVRPLVEHPDGLGGVHRRATAQADDPVGLEPLRHLHSLAHGLDAGIGLHPVEDARLYASLVEMGLHLVHQAQLDQYGVGDNESALALQLIKRIQRPLAEDNLWRDKVPHSTASLTILADWYIGRLVDWYIGNRDQPPIYQFPNLPTYQSTNPRSRWAQARSRRRSPWPLWGSA